MNVIHERAFTAIGDFRAVRAAEAWCTGLGISFGAMQAGSPRGLLVGNFSIEKWRNLSRAERDNLHGQMVGDFRDGPVRVILFDNCPPLPGVVP